MYDIIVQILVGLFVGIILLCTEYFYFLNDKNNKKRYPYLGTTYMLFTHVWISILILSGMLIHIKKATEPLLQLLFVVSCEYNRPIHLPIF